MIRRVSIRRVSGEFVRYSDCLHYLALKRMLDSRYPPDTASIGELEFHPRRGSSGVVLPFSGLGMHLRLEDT